MLQISSYKGAIKSRAQSYRTTLYLPVNNDCTIWVHNCDDYIPKKIEEKEKHDRYKLFQRQSYSTSLTIHTVHVFGHTSMYIFLQVY